MRARNAKAKPVPKRGRGIHKLQDGCGGFGYTVALVGAGGSGSQMLSGLVRMDRALRSLDKPGLNVIVYDPDIVTLANVGRQAFYPGEIGTNKAVALVQRANVGFGLSWMAVPDRWTPDSLTPHGGGMYSAPDFLITCVDSGRARREIGEACQGARHMPRYWLDLGNSRDKGQVILGELRPARFGSVKVSDAIEKSLSAKEALALQRLPTVLEMYPEHFTDEVLAAEEAENEPSCSLAEALAKQDLFVNDHVCVWAKHLLWKLLRDGETDTRGYLFNLPDGRANPVPVEAACP